MKKNGELKRKLIPLHLEHPDWSAPQLARALGTSMESVRSAAKRYSLEIPLFPEQSYVYALGAECVLRGISMDDLERMSEATSL